MKKLHIVIVIPLICQNIYSKEDERHSHEGSANIKLNYELLDFKIQKRKIVAIDMELRLIERG